MANACLRASYWNPTIQSPAVKTWVRVLTTTYSLSVDQTIMDCSGVSVSGAAATLTSTNPPENYAVGYQVRVRIYDQAFPPTLCSTYYFEIQMV